MKFLGLWMLLCLGSCRVVCSYLDTVVNIIVPGDNISLIKPCLLFQLLQVTASHL